VSYHIINIDTPSCSLTCRDGQLTCRSDQGERKLPLEDVAAIIITSFNASIHSHLFLEAAKHGVALIICESFKPVSLVLPANRSTDTLLSRALLDLEPRVRESLWRRTVDAKCQNQALLATHISANDVALEQLKRTATGRLDHKEAICAKLFWNIFGRALGDAAFRRETDADGGINALLNYGYAVLLSTVLQKLFAVGLDPTWGLSHVARERATPLAYDLMEPFRPCVDWRVWQWTRQHTDPAEWQVTNEYRAWVTGFVLERVEHLEFTLEIRGVIEGVIRSFRRAVMENAVRPYRPWNLNPANGRQTPVDPDRYKMGWLLVSFDLPVGTKEQRKQATDFREFLKDDGFIMIQWSVYARSCVCFARQETHLDRVKKNLPPEGSVRAWFLTRVQWESSFVIHGAPASAVPPEEMPEQIQLW
jgi:CRISP-associated protein Cas1